MDPMLSARRTDVLMHSTQLVAFANQLLDIAEKNRRVLTPKFETAADPARDPTADYAIAGGLIDAARAHLDESIPLGQVVRSETALGVLCIGVDLLVAALAERGVHPSRVYFGPRSENAYEAPAP